MNHQTTTAPPGCAPPGGSAKRWYIFDDTLVCHPAQERPSIQTNSKHVAKILCAALNDRDALRETILTIGRMAFMRKTVIRMKDGRMLDDFCRAALPPNSEVSEPAARGQRKQ